MWVEQNMSKNVQQNGGWCSYTLECVRNNVTSKKMQKNIIIPCRCMHERETVMQSGENPAMLVVCVCVKQFLHTLYILNKTKDFLLSLGMMHPLPHVNKQLLYVSVQTFMDLSQEP